MVELDEALYLRHLIRHLCQLGGEQALLSGQDLQIGGGAMLHQEGGAAVGCLQGIDLLCVQLSFLLGGLVLHQCLVDLCACLQQRLLELKACLLLLRLGDLQLTRQLPFGKERLRQVLNENPILHLSEEEIQLLAHYGQLIDYRLHMKGRPYSKAVLTDVRYQLKYSQKSIKEIADYLDFPNISFFGKFVRRHVGCSPKEYRRRLQAEQ